MQDNTKNRAALVEPMSASDADVKKERGEDPHSMRDNRQKTWWVTAISISQKGKSREAPTKHQLVIETGMKCRSHRRAGRVGNLLQEDRLNYAN